RIVVVRVPYNLRLSEEVKIYQKIIRHSDFRAHVAPHTLEFASMFAILSRLEPTAKCDLMTKLKLYNGEEVVEKGRTKKVDVQELREASKREGMSGISTRFIMKALDNALSDNTAGNCINPINVREALINMSKEADMPDDTRKQYLEFLQDTLHKEYLELLEKEITRAFVYSYQEQAEGLFQNYLDHAEAYINKSKVKDRNTKEELTPDEGFMKSIEEQIAIIGSAADGFRQEVIAYLWAANRRGEKIDYRSYEPLKEAIEKKLITSVRDLSRVITKARMRDEEQSEKYNTMVKNLLDHGYCHSCVDMILKNAEYRFVYGENVPGVGQGGDGELQPGQTVGKGKEGAQGRQAGDQAGVDYYETEVSLDELVEVMYEDLELPDLDRKNLRQMEVERQFRHKGFRKKGIRVRLDKKRTARSRVKRKKASQRADVATLHGERFPFHKDDLRYHHNVTETRRESNAVVLCIMDTSGSMDTMKKYLARSFFFLLYRFLCTRYQNVEIVFIAHHTEAQEVTEEEFFHKGESGGTFISSGYNKALEIIY